MTKKSGQGYKRSIVPPSADFDPTKLETYFSNVTRLPCSPYSVPSNGMAEYLVTDVHGNEKGQIIYGGGHDFMYMVDPFPAPRRYFSCNLPVRCLQQFLKDVERIGLVLIPLGSKK